MQGGAGSAGNTSGGAGASGGAGLGGSAGALGEAGEAGLGEAGALNCEPGDVAPAGSLVHRYSFDGTGTVAVDSVGTANGDLVEATALASNCDDNMAKLPPTQLDGNGQLTFDGCRGYVNFPNHLFMGLSDVTLMSWATWSGGAAFERYFDFGVGDGEDVTTGQGWSFIAVSVGGTDNTGLQLAVRQAQTVPVESLRTFIDLDDKREHQVVAVFASNAYVELYLDGNRLGHLPIAWPLSVINDVNEWVGRSQWSNDHTFNGKVNEFRMYKQALSPCAIRAIYEAGPNSP